MIQKADRMAEVAEKDRLLSHNLSLNRSGCKPERWIFKALQVVLMLPAPGNQRMPASSTAWDSGVASRAGMVNIWNNWKAKI